MREETRSAEPDLPLLKGSAEYQLALALVDFAVADLLVPPGAQAASLRERAACRTVLAAEAMLGSRLTLLGIPSAGQEPLPSEELERLASYEMAVIRWYAEGLSPAARSTLSSYPWPSGDCDDAVPTGSDADTPC